MESKDDKEFISTTKPKPSTTTSSILLVSFLVLFFSLVFSHIFFNSFMGNESSSSLKKNPIQTGDKNDPKMNSRCTLALGCFWGSEHYFKKRFGTKIAEVQVGYVGGTVASPNYRQVCSGSTGHAEAVTFKFDPNQVSYNELLKFFFSVHNPTTQNRQGNDTGSQYRSAIFFHTPEQKELADQLIKSFNTPGSVENNLLTKAHGCNARVVTTVEDGSQTFYSAEDYHQGYLEANPGGYCNHKIYFTYP